jgi:hypothetical protein
MGFRQFDFQLKVKTKKVKPKQLIPFVVTLMQKRVLLRSGALETASHRC